MKLIFTFIAIVVVALSIGLAVYRWSDTPRDSADASSPVTQPRQLWTCGMHPQVIRDAPGDCPICHMKLTPVKTSSATLPSETTIVIDPVVVQNMGVRVAPVVEQPLHRSVRAVGYLGEVEPKRYDVNLRVSGWIEKLYADTEGMAVAQGEPLFELYSPQVQVAAEELIAAGRTAGADPLFRQAVQRKLQLWGLSDEQIAEMSALEKPPTTITFRSPMSGHVVEKNIVQGAAVKEGERVLRIVDHSTLWLDAQVYEQDLPLMKLGQQVEASIASLPGQTFTGKVIFIHPHVDPMTRTTTVRMEIPNEPMTLRPGMYAVARIDAQLADAALVVPREAVIDTGTRQIAFVARSRGRFEPRKVTTGHSGDDGMIQILQGLSPGEQVVVSGQFLLDAESRMREAVEKHLAEKLLKPQTGMQRVQHDH